MKRIDSMKIKKSNLVKLILKEIDYVSDDRSSFMFYGDHVWPDLNPNNLAQEENTQLETETLTALVNYYQSNDPFSSSNLSLST